MFTREEEQKRYSKTSILRSEWMYGEGFQSSGGTKILDRLCERLKMKEGAHMLEVGSGLGGTASYFVTRYGITVDCMDASAEMISISKQRFNEDIHQRLNFVNGDIGQTPLPDSRYDLVWSRDCFLYVQEKFTAFSHIYNTLKPGGQLLVVDYCRGKKLGSEEFEDYVQTCNFNLLSARDYAKQIRNAGFESVTSEDWTESFIAHLYADQEHLLNDKRAFLSQFTQEDFDYLSTRWHSKIEFAEQGDICWWLFYARKL